MNFLIVLAAILLAYCASIRAYKIWYLSSDKHFKDGAIWPSWLIKDAEKWNNDNPDKQVRIRK